MEEGITTYGGRRRPGEGTPDQSAALKIQVFSSWIYRVNKAYCREGKHFLKKKRFLSYLHY